MAVTDWIQKLLKTDAGIRLGQKAVMLDDLQKVAQHNRDSVAAFQRQSLGDDMPLMEKDEAGMGVQVGDNHIYPTSTPEKSGMSPFVAGLIGAGLLATGVGGLAGAYFIADAIKNIKPDPVVTPVIPANPGDGDTKYTLKLLP